MKLSLVIPVYNEEKNLDEFYETTKKELKKIKYELIFINDGSKDKSLEVLKSLAKKDKKVKIISFSRNFGKEAAIYAGLKNITGEYTAIIDSDLQQHPKYLIEMYNELEESEEYDSICMCQAKRKENFMVSFIKKIGYKLMDAVTDVKFVNGASDFRMFRRNVLNAILEMSERNRFSKGIFSWVGFNTKYMTYEVMERKAGKTSWSLKSLISYGVDGFVGFTTKPLRVSTYIGFLTSLIAFIYFIIILLQTLITGKDIPGYASMMCVILFLGGIQLLCIGIVGEYLARTYIESKERPIYIEKERINFSDKED